MIVEQSSGSCLAVKSFIRGMDGHQSYIRDLDGSSRLITLCCIQIDWLIVHSFDPFLVIPISLLLAL